VVELTSEREFTNGSRSTEKRYYLTSHAPDAEKLLDLIRRHWGIENRCHWVLDVTFNKDQCRARMGHAAQNLALLRKLISESRSDRQRHHSRKKNQSRALRKDPRSLHENRQSKMR
jgi:predicted transposase YbfD/YdcC